MNLRLSPILIALIVLTVSGSQLGAHEFWLEPDEFSPKLDARTGVRIRIGEYFDGALYPYLTGTFLKFTAGQGESEQAVEGLDGDDDPAIGVAFRKETLAIVAHQSQSNHVTLEPWTKFTEYLAEIGQDDIAKRHRALGKPTEKVEERYYRAAKLLLDVVGLERRRRVYRHAIGIGRGSQPVCIGTGRKFAGAAFARWHADRRCSGHGVCEIRAKDGPARADR